MSSRSRSFAPTPALAALAAAVLFVLASAGPARGDDRDLLRAAQGDPYLFVLLDTSGSMNWSPPCSQADFDAGHCSPLCPTGDCFVPMQSDDPGSKFYVAKEALYTVLKDQSIHVNLGFATYNQDGLSVEQKHWLYQASNGGITIPSWGAFPAAGSREVFGLNWGCDTGNNDNEIGCTFAKPADLPDSWELTRMQRLPKGGLTFTVGTQTEFFVRYPANTGTVYRVRYTAVSGTYGSNLVMNLNIWQCKNSTCSTASSSSTTPLTTLPVPVVFTPVSDFVSWDNADTSNTDRTNPAQTFYSSAAVDSTASNTCSGWDPNTDTGSDKVGGYTLRFPTDSADPRGSLLTKGDVIPLDWNTDRRQDVLSRLAPNSLSSPNSPDFRVATYLKDNRQGGDSYLRLKSESVRPLVASGSTPLGASLNSIKSWYSSWKARASDASQSDYDTAFTCRKKYVLLLTDGDETCSGDPCAAADALKALDPDLTVYVIAFGLQTTSPTLNCIGGRQGDPSHTPYVKYPQDKQALIDAIRSTLADIVQDTRAFASAAVPSVQADVADRIYLSSFRGINKFAGGDRGAFVWDGHLDAYLKPLPLSNGKPNRDLACPAAGGSQPRSSCHLWDAGEVLVSQAPTAGSLATTIDQSTLKLGLSTSERRVFYGKAKSGNEVPQTLRLLYPPIDDIQTSADWRDLWRGFKLPDPASTADYGTTKTRVQTLIKNTLSIKQAVVQVNNSPTTINYVMGDIFHADPVLLDRPNDFFAFSANLYGTKGLNSDCVDDPGYRCYSQKHHHRRKLLLLGANDGQLHAVDAGVWDADAAAFTDGTGTEVFSLVPRLGMPIVRDQVEGSHEIFGVDGTPRVDDVFIDPKHNGTPTADEREWRTVAVGGFREGGSIDGGGRVADFVTGYYAVDITQPDKLDNDHEPINDNVVPTCLTLDNQATTGCGTNPFPSVLWEFTDSLQGSRLDEDKNGVEDLGQTWSVPTIGRIRVVDGTEQLDKFVAIFGGGMDAENKTSPQRGTWLYMVDIETGQTLYKHSLIGAAAADPAVLDVDLDGYLDTIYVGTTAGFLYKVDISSVGVLKNLTLQKDQFLPNLGAAFTVKRVVDTAWDPFPIFSSGGKPLYMPPTAFFVSRLSKFALAFGTGDREALLQPTNTEGRFYVIIDDGFKLGDTMKTDSDYQEIKPSDAQAGTGTDYILNPQVGKQRGWYLRLPNNERVITQAFGLSGIVIFSSFQPDTSPCSNGGASHIFVVFANNGDAVMTDAPSGGSGGPSGTGNPIRFRTVNYFVTNPYVEQGSTKNPPSNGTANSEDLDATQKDILNSLKKFFPKGTKFANYWISISGVRSDTGYERYATGPVGIIERNWKEF